MAGLPADEFLSEYTESKSVGASLLAIAIYQAQLILRMYPNPCGSWLASDDGGTFSTDVD